MDSTKLPIAAELFIGQWARKDAPEPRLDAPLLIDDTTIKVSYAFLDEDAAIVTKPFLFGIRKSNNWVETCLKTSGVLNYDAQTANFTVGEILTGGTSGAKALIVEDTDNGTTGTLNLIVTSGTFQDNETITGSGGGSATANGTLTNSTSSDGLTLSNVIRGIDPAGLDWTVGSSDFADTHDAGEPVFCNIPAVQYEMIRAALQGIIATGGSGIILGTDESGTVTLSKSTGVGTSAGFLRHNGSKAQYSNDGAAWNNIDDVTASNLVVVSGGDTTPGNLETKAQAGSGITITKRNSGGNEYLEFATSLPTQISEPGTYTPAYLTCGTNGQTDPAVWDSVSDASFRVTIDGTAYNIDGIDFTPQAGGTMSDMAGVIQAAIRAATSGSETVVWSTDHFVITSADTTASSEVSVLTTSTGTVGTDISGAGASNWMDGDTGNGVATAAVLDQTADSGKVALLDSTGKFNKLFIPVKTASSGSGDAGFPIGGNSSGQIDGSFLNIFGDGSDGSATISSNTALSADKNYTNLTIQDGFTLNPNGFIIKVSGTLTFEGTGKIQYNGSNGGDAVDASAGVSGSPGAAASVDGVGYLKNVAGANGGTAVVAAGPAQGGAGDNGTAASVIETNSLGSSGAGGSNSGAGGGAAGSNGAETIAASVPTTWSQGYLESIIRPAASSGGGGAGAITATSNERAGDGGASGNTGGIVVLFAKNIVTVNGNDYIQADGGDGGDGGDAAIGAGSGAVGGGGGGAGGNGGIVFVAYSTKTGTGTVSVSGGTGGSGGVGAGTGANNGASGANGASGHTYILKV